MTATRHTLGPLLVAGIVALLSQNVYLAIGVGVALWVAFLIAFGLDRPWRLAVAAVLSGAVGVAWFGLLIPGSFSDGRCGIEGAAVYCPGLADAYAIGLYGALGAVFVSATALAVLFLHVPAALRFGGAR